MHAYQIAGSILLIVALGVVAWPILREGRSFLGKRRPARTILAGLLLIAGAVLLLAPKIVADGIWSLAPDRCLILAMDRITDPADHRVRLLSRRIGAGAVTDDARAALVRRCADRLERSDDPLEWRFVVVLLSSVPMDDSALVDALIRGVDHDDPHVREQAVYALAGAPEPKAVPALAIACEDPVDSVRAIAAWALRPHARDADLDAAGVAALERLLHDRAPNVRYQGAETLSFVDAEPARLVPALASGLDSPDVFTRIRAAGALARLGADATPALDALERTARNADAIEAGAARNAIERITSLAATGDD